MKTRLKLGAIRRFLGPDYQDLDDDAPVIRRAHLSDPTILSRDGDDAPRVALQVVSSGAVDDYDTIIDPAGLDLDRFRTNPVVLWGHRYNEPPIGSDRRIWEEAGKVIAETVYSRTARADEVWQLKREGHLKAHSITFSPVETVPRGRRHWASVCERYGVDTETGPYEIYTRSVLLEHSDVSIGANADAVTLAVSRGLRVSEDILTEIGARKQDSETRAVVIVKPRLFVRNLSAEIRQAIDRERGKL